MPRRKENKQIQYLKHSLDNMRRSRDKYREVFENMVQARNDQTSKIESLRKELEETQGLLNDLLEAQGS